MANPKSESARQSYLDANPFDGMKIADTSILDDLKGRHPCPKCNKSRKFFCYTCYVPIEPLQPKLPRIKLPIKIDIIKHRQEIDGKSTSAHAAIIASDDVQIYTYPDIPSYENERVVLIFPSQAAISIQQLLTFDSYEKMRANYSERMLKLGDTDPKGFHRPTLMTVNEMSKLSITESLDTRHRNDLIIDKAIFIDSTWNQSRGIYKDPKIREIPCVVIKNRISQFWRHQKGSPRWYLATIEAIHQFLLEIHINLHGIEANYFGIDNCFTETDLQQLKQLKQQSNAMETELYRGQYDNLLFFFKHMYDLIHQYYQHEELYAYKRRLN